MQAVSWMSSIVTSCCSPDTEDLSMFLLIYIKAMLKKIRYLQPSNVMFNFFNLQSYQLPWVFLIMFIAFHNWKVNFGNHFTKISPIHYLIYIFNLVKKCTSLDKKCVSVARSEHTAHDSRCHGYSLRAHCLRAYGNGIQTNLLVTRWNKINQITQMFADVMWNRLVSFRVLESEVLHCHRRYPSGSRIDICTLCL